MKRLLIAAFTALCATPALAQQPANWTQPVAPFRVIDNVYYVGTAGLSSFLIVTPQGDALLDVGLPQNAALVEENIRALGFKITDIKLLLVNHAHYDHAGGMAKLKADTGAAVVAAEGERYALEHGVYEGAESDKTYDFPPVHLDRAVKNGEVVRLGGVAFTAHLTPGHTRGATTWSWPVKDEAGKPHTAFMFSSASMSINTLIPPLYPGIVRDYQHTFAIAHAIPGDVFLAPHAEFFDLEAKRARLAAGAKPNPFIDRAMYDKLVDAQEADFKRHLAAEQQKAAKP